jgi:hypothetical protein
VLILLGLFSYEVNILVTGRETLLNVSGILLTTEDGYDFEGGWHLEA